jgi:hypothetical protein
LLAVSIQGYLAINIIINNNIESIKPHKSIPGPAAWASHWLLLRLVVKP